MENKSGLMYVVGDNTNNGGTLSFSGSQSVYPLFIFGIEIPSVRGTSPFTGISLLITL
jgi:hypothetical protein